MDIRLKRTLALALDYFFIIFTFATLVMILGLFIPNISLYLAIVTILLLLEVYIYFTVIPLLYNGMTIGSSVFNIRTINTSGKNAGVIGLTFRNIHIVFFGALALFFTVSYDIQVQTDGRTYEELSDALKQVYDKGLLQMQYGLTVAILVATFFGISVLILGNRGINDFMGKTKVVEKDDY